jgi:hypothetical protein
VRSVLLAFVAALTAAGSVIAEPALPRRIRALPVYDATLGIRISWLERAGAEYYNLYRSVDGSPEIFVATFLSKGADQFISYLDQPAVATSDYTYRVQACDVSGCSTSPPFTNSPRVVWPIAGGHEVMHGYNEVIGWAGIGNEPVLVDPGPPRSTTPSRPVTTWAST